MMTIRTSEGRTSFRPLEEITGEASWSLDGPVRAIALELLWTTRGRGTVDTVIVDSVCYESPPQNDARAFRLHLPDSPYSFAGTLVSVGWAVRLVADPGGETAQAPIVVSPTGREIELARRG